MRRWGWGGVGTRHMTHSPEPDALSSAHQPLLDRVRKSRCLPIGPTSASRGCWERARRRGSPPIPQALRDFWNEPLGERLCPCTQSLRFGAEWARQRIPLQGHSAFNPWPLSQLLLSCPTLLSGGKGAPAPRHTSLVWRPQGNAFNHAQVRPHVGTGWETCDHTSLCFQGRRPRRQLPTFCSRRTGRD